jgi:hypothetical protein
MEAIPKDTYVALAQTDKQFRNPLLGLARERAPSGCEWILWISPETKEKVLHFTYTLFLGGLFLILV